MLKAAAWIREDLKTHPRVAELLSFVVGPNPIGGIIYKDGVIDASQNISTPLAQVSLQSLYHDVKADCQCEEIGDCRTQFRRWDCCCVGCSDERRVPSS